MVGIPGFPRYLLGGRRREGFGVVGVRGGFRRKSWTRVGPGGSLLFGPFDEDPTSGRPSTEHRGDDGDDGEETENPDDEDPGLHEV
jgi:hypothetical protein